MTINDSPKETTIHVKNVSVDYMDANEGTFAFLVETTNGPGFIIAGEFVWHSGDDMADSVDFNRIIEAGAKPPTIDNPVLSYESEEMLMEYVDSIYNHYSDRGRDKSSICEHLGMFFG